MNCTTVVCIFGRRGNIRTCHTRLMCLAKLPVTKDGYRVVTSPSSVRGPPAALVGQDPS